MSKREIRQVLASGGLSLIAKPKDASVASSDDRDKNTQGTQVAVTASKSGSTSH